jgi:hypothetical protein
MKIKYHCKRCKKLEETDDKVMGRSRLCLACAIKEAQELGELDRVQDLELEQEERAEKRRGR